MKPDFEKASTDYYWEFETDKSTQEPVKARVITAFKAGCEHAYSIDKWISVKDRLPEDRMLHVLVFNGDAPEYNQHVFHAIWFLQRMNFKCVQNGYNYLGQITHWQPLPEPPKN